MQSARKFWRCAMKKQVMPWNVLSLRLLAGFFATTLAPSSTLADDAPTIDKDSLVVITAEISGSRDAPKDKQLQWKPGISFRVNGPIAGGSQLWVQFGYPGRKDWAKFDSSTSETPAGESWHIKEGVTSDKLT